jgi:filamentous hemagglutinin family protein
MQRQLIGFTLTGMVVLTAAATASAQTVGIVPDTSLGNENSIVNLDGANGDRITGGATRGSNLFHSFESLSIGTNQTAWFDNPAAIQSILVRVTGRNPSAIDGTIRSNGTADLFILNPNGISFGQNAKLNIGGGLAALTTPAIPLGEQGLFSAVAPAQSQLLAIKPTAQFDLAQFQPQAEIKFNANWVTKGQEITFVGKPIVMSGSLTNTVAAPTTTLTLRSASDISLTKTQINNPSGKPLYIAENNAAPVRLILEAGANRLGQGNITIQDADIGLYGGLFQATAPGKITFERSRLFSQSFINNRAEPISFQGGTVEIIGKSTKEAEAAAITIATDPTIQNTEQSVSPATLTIRAIKTILIENTRINQPVKNAQGQNEPELYPATFDPSRVPKRANFYPTNITLDSQQNITLKSAKIAPRSGRFQANTPADFLFKNSQLYSDNYTNQDSAPIVVQAQNIVLEDPEGMSGNAIYRGRAADIILTATNNLTLRNAGIGSNTIDSGDAGDIKLTAGNQLTVDNGGFGNQSGAKDFKNNDQVKGNNGRVIFTANQIVVKNYGVNIESYGRGGGGQILLDAQAEISIGVGGFNTKANGSVQGADILVKAGTTVNMQPQSGLNTTAENKGQGGNIRVEAKALSLRGSISTSTKGQGPAGNIVIEAPTIDVQQEVFTPDPKKPERTQIERGTISSYTGTPKEESTIQSGGRAGDITLNAIGPDGQIMLRSGAGIANTSFANSQGNAGNVVLRSSQLDIQRGSQVVIATNGIGNTGTIDVETTKAITLTGADDTGKAPSSILSTIRSKATGISSQDIKIKSARLEIEQGAGIIASTLGDGNSGNISVNAKTVTLNGTNTRIGADGKATKLTSGILTSVGISNLPDTGNNQKLIREEQVRGVTVTTLQPLVSPGFSNDKAKGNSGNITLQLGQLNITEDAQLATVILGNGKAGNIDIATNGNIRLLDRGAIRADSGSGQGGSIAIAGQQVLLLRRGGTISAVSRANGQDGNININTPFIVGIPDENSDIFAVSQEALNGGRSVGNNVKIKAQGILGFEYRNQFTNQNDIIATGNVTLNLPDIDPSRGLTVFPIVPIDIAQKIDRRCNPNAANPSSAFTTLGSGGLPANPSHAIVPNGLRRLATLPDDRPASQPPIRNAIAIPIEAQTAIRLAYGQIRFQSTTPGVIATNPRSDCLNRPDR